MTKTPIKTALLGMAAAAGLMAAPAAHAQDRLLLNTPVAFSTKLPGLGSPIPRVAEQLDLMSSGEIFPALEQGAIDAPEFRAKYEVGTENAFLPRA